MWRWFCERSLSADFLMFWTLPSVWGRAAWTFWASSSLWVTVRWRLTWSTRGRSWSDAVRLRYRTGWEPEAGGKYSLCNLLFSSERRKRQRVEDGENRRRVSGLFQQSETELFLSVTNKGILTCFRSGRSVTGTRERTTLRGTGAATRWRRPLTQTPAAADVSTVGFFFFCAAQVMCVGVTLLITWLSEQKPSILAPGAEQRGTASSCCRTPNL